MDYKIIIGSGTQWKTCWLCGISRNKSNKRRKNDQYENFEMEILAEKSLEKHLMVRNLGKIFMRSLTMYNLIKQMFSFQKGL